MRLHEPKVEKALLTAVRAVLARPHSGKRRLRKDGSFRRMLNLVGGALLVQAVLTLLLLALLGYTHLEPRTPGCLNVVVGLWFLLGSNAVLQSVLRESFHTNEVQTLWMLPVPGEPILWRALRRSLWQTWPTLLRACLVCVLLTQSEETSLPGVGRGLLNGVALWLVTLAMAAVEVHPVLDKAGLGKLWHALRLGGRVALGALAMATVYHWKWLPVQDWLEASAPVLVWLLPPAWITAPLTGFSFGPLWLPPILSLALVVTGLWRWLQWPKLAAPSFDSLPDVPDLGAGEEEENAGASVEERVQTISDRKEAASERVRDLTETMRLTLGRREGDTLMAGGWIPRLVLRLLSGRDRAILPVLMRKSPAWSKNYRRALIGILAILPLVFIANRLPGMLHAKDPVWDIIQGKAYFAACWGAAILLLLYVVPIGGDVSDAVALWPAGTQPLPFLCGFPVTSGDLLRVSWKIVGVRTVLAALLAVPAAWFLGWQYDGDWHTGVVAASLVVRLLWVLLSVRPLMVVHRLGTATRWRGGFWLWKFVASLFIMVLLVVLLVAAGTFLAFAAADSGQPGTGLHAPFWTLVLGLAPLLLSLVIFWCFQWKLRRRGVDYGPKPAT